MWLVWVVWLVVVAQERVGLYDQYVCVMVRKLERGIGAVRKPICSCRCVDNSIKRTLLRVEHDTMSSKFKDSSTGAIEL